MKSKLLKKISLVAILVISLSGCAKKYSVEEYKEDASFLTETMQKVEDEFITLLGTSDSETCAEWIKTVRQNMIDNTTTDLGDDIVNAYFDMYEVAYNLFVEKGSIGNPSLIDENLSEMSRNSKIKEADEKLQEALVALRTATGQ